MFARVHESTEIKTGNSGSCFALAKYLDKEAEKENVSGDTQAERETSSRLVHYLDKEEGNNFFSSTSGKYDMAEVIANIDANKKHLGKDDTKFYMLTINPSVEEQKHLIGEDIEDFHSLSKEKQDAVKQKLVELTRASMDAYARNFGRKNINSGDDLLYYARIETQRTYKKNSEEVRNGTAKAGDLKPGLNLHVHIIVSRNSKDQKTKLSPHVKSKGNSWVLNGDEVKRGFNHEMWKQEVQNIFNEKFDYVSKETETYVPKKSSFYEDKEKNEHVPEKISAKEETRQRQLRTSKFVGSVTVINAYGVDTIHFSDKKDFVRTIEEKMKSEDKDKWSFKVLTKLPSVRKKVDDIFCKINGRYNDTPFVWYRENKGFAKVNQQDYRLNQYVGAISKTENGNTQYTYYTDKETYLKELKKSMENKTWSGYITFTSDALVRQKADDMAFESYGRKNPCPKEKYEEMENWRTETTQRGRYCFAIYVREITKEVMDEKVKDSGRNNNNDGNKEKTVNVKKLGKPTVRGALNGKTPMISISSEIKKRAKNEILKDNFQTERAIIGKTSMVIRTLSNPAASVKQMIISEIKNMLNPVKEL